MSNLVKKLIIGGMIAGGITLASLGLFQKDGKMDKTKDIIEYGAGLGLIAGGIVGSYYNPKKKYQAN